MGFTVLYAWQSDQDRKAARFLIRDAAKRAPDRVVADGAMETAPAQRSLGREFSYLWFPGR